MVDNEPATRGDNMKTNHEPNEPKRYRTAEDKLWNAINAVWDNPKRKDNDNGKRKGAKRAARERIAQRNERSIQNENERGDDNNER